MTETNTFNAEERSDVGTGAARATRNEAGIPANIYGANKDPLPITNKPL